MNESPTPVAWMTTWMTPTLTPITKIYQTLSSAEHHKRTLDFYGDCGEITITPMYTMPPNTFTVEEMRASKFEANELWDSLTSALQWLWNIRDGISTPEVAIENTEVMIAHCREVQDRLRSTGTYSRVVETPTASFQSRVKPWVLETFGTAVALDILERNDRFCEESLELLQSLGYSKDRAHSLVEYVFSRDIGDPTQEVGGVMVTLAALCTAANLDMQNAGETELARIWTKIDSIREKHKTKP